MRYLSPFKLYEEDTRSCFTLSEEEIEQLPAFQKLMKYLNGASIDARRELFKWDNSPISYRKGIRSFKLGNSIYTFKINPCTGTIYYGQEKVNKNFYVDLTTKEGWNHAIEEIGKYSIAREYGVPIATIKNLHKNAKKLGNLVAFGHPLSDGSIPNFGKVFLFGFIPNKTDLDKKSMNTLAYLLDGEVGGVEVMKSLSSLVASDITNIKYIPDTFDKVEILKGAGYTENQARSLIGSSDLGIF